MLYKWSIRNFGAANGYFDSDDQHLKIIIYKNDKRHQQLYSLNHKFVRHL